MYETLCSLGALLFQGLAAGIFIAILTRRFEKKDSRKRYEAAAMFISMELTEHLVILAATVNGNKLLPPDSPTKFSTSAWLDFRSDLVGHMPVSKLKEITAYYRSINQIWALSVLRASYYMHEELIVTAYANCEHLRNLLASVADISNNHNRLVRALLRMFRWLWG